MTLEKQIKEWERIKRICINLQRRNTPNEYNILMNKLNESVKKYNKNYQTFYINKRPR
ncbi:MAG: hypothetical protein IIA87_03280 [Nanoarchaeota archaeon]|nr:hypothetical protein [Nanoarchaeota archaeon]